MVRHTFNRSYLCLLASYFIRSEQYCCLEAGIFNSERKQLSCEDAMASVHPAVNTKMRESQRKPSDYGTPNVALHTYTGYFFYVCCTETYTTDRALLINMLLPWSPFLNDSTVLMLYLVWLYISLCKDPELEEIVIKTDIIRWFWRI